MSIRVTLRSPFGATAVRDVVGGRWAEPSGEAEVELGADMWALPGMADAHAHLARERLELEPGDFEGAVARAKAALDAGVTLILDKGWTDTTTVDVERSVAPVERPEIEAAARMIAVEGGYYPNFAREAGPGELAEVVSREAEEGIGWVKLVGDWPRKGRGPLPNFSEDELRIAVETAGSAGARVAIHTMAPDVPSAAVAAGVHSVEHGLFLRESDLEVLGARQGMWVPTVSRVEALVGQLGTDSSGGRLLLEGLDNVRRLLPVAVEAGVHVLTGTDLAGAPSDVSAEAVKLAEYGLSDVDAVKALTTSAFIATGRAADFAPGSAADAVLYPEDPTANLEVLSSPSHVIRLGAVR